jgi:hypothetical protein
MIQFIEYQVIIAPSQHGNHSQIYLKTGTVAKSSLLAGQFCQSVFQLSMNIESPVQKTRTGTAGTVFFDSPDGGFFNFGMAGQTQITV